MTSQREDAKFKEDVIPDNALESAIEWIADCLTPGDVFSEEALQEYVATTWSPNEVFDEDILALWAVDNGYVKE